MKEMAEDSRGQDRGLDALDASEREERRLCRMRPQRAHPIHYFLLSFLNDRPNCHRESVLIRVFTASNLRINSRTFHVSISRVYITNLEQDRENRGRNLGGKD